MIIICEIRFYEAMEKVMEKVEVDDDLLDAMEDMFVMIGYPELTRTLRILRYLNELGLNIEEYYEYYIYDRAMMANEWGE